MPKLIVEDAGTKRAFRLSKGRLTIGASADSKLTLESEGVAEQHAVLTILPTGGRVDAAAEVRIDGQPALGESLDLPVGSTLEVGAAKLSLLADTGDDAAPSSAGSGGKRPQASKAPVANASAGGGGAARAGTARPGSTRTKSGRSRRKGSAASVGVRTSSTRAGSRGRKEEKGLPGWLLPVIVIAVLGGGVLAYMAKGGGSNNPNGLMNAAETMLAEGNVDSAKGALAKINQTRLSAEQSDRFRNLTKQADDALSFASAAERRNEGVAVIDSELLGFAAKHLTEEPYEAPKGRMYLEKLAAFRAEFPDWNSAVWTENSSVKQTLDQAAEIEAKALEVTSLDTPPTIEDVQLSRHLFATGSKDGTGRRDFRDAFTKLAAALAAADDTTRPDLEALRTSLIQERRDYAAMRIGVAKTDFETYKQDSSSADLQRSADKLIQLVIEIDDPAIQAEASGILLALPRLQDLILPSYRQNKPDVYAEMLKYPAIRNVAEVQGDSAGDS